jgi:hypothetical protein
VEDDGFEDVPGRRRKAAIIVRFLLVMALLMAFLIVVNEFYGRPLRGSRWLRLETYRTTIGNIVGSKPTVKPDHIQQPRMIDIKGIAYSNDKSSAIIGNRLVHVGDVVSDAMIIDIGPKNISFQADGRTWTQKVH